MTSDSHTISLRMEGHVDPDDAEDVAWVLGEALQGSVINPLVCYTPDGTISITTVFPSALIGLLRAQEPPDDDGELCTGFGGS